MKKFFIKNYIVFAILKCLLLLISIANVYNFYKYNIELFNQNIISFSDRFLIGKYIIVLMLIHTVFEAVSTINVFSFYSKKYSTLNYFLGFLSIIISLPLFYNFIDDFQYYGGKVSPISLILPLFYFVCGIFDFIISGKAMEE